ncbi:MAG: membrane dipeptidase [Muribaculaceae bacterium]|nr:membrane dipeptidase [Muribaculaceae bacterium]
MKRVYILFLICFICIYAYGVQHKPIIGISCSNSELSSSVSKSYCDAVNRSGGIAMMIPVCTDSMILREVVGCIDGIIMTGGGDIHPSYFGEEMVDECGVPDSVRDIYDIHLIKLAAQHCIPMLGICRGEQLINVAFGGTLFQDLPSQFPGDTLFQHRNADHEVILQTDSWISNITRVDSFVANSYHHQAIKDVAPGFIVSGWSHDNVIEVIENVDGYPIWGVQFHPERMFEDNYPIASSIFDFFIKKASTYRHAKELHRKIISIDTHTDSPLDFKGTYSIGNRGQYQVDIPKMQEGYLDAQYLACWVRQGELSPNGRLKAKNRIDDLIESIYQQVERNYESCGIARTTHDIYKLKSEGKKAFLIGIENGYALGKDINLIEEYFKKGVTYITLCHSINNDICDSSSDKSGPKWNGLSPFGKKVIAEMNRLGILIDLSHASDATFWDVMNLSEVPVFASHSSSRAIYNCDRNLSDEQLRAIAETGGVAQACLVDEFLTSNPKSSNIEDFMNHLCHIIDVAGIDHVGIGSDFDGGAGVKGCNGDNDLIQITMRLIERGFSDEDIAKIWGGNFLRVLSNAQKYASEMR